MVQTEDTGYSVPGSGANAARSGQHLFAGATLAQMSVAQVNLPLQRAAEAYGIEPAALEPLGAFESEVFAFTGPSGPSILKIIAPEHRSPEQVQAELDWLVALDEASINVAAPIPSKYGRLLELVDDFMVIAFRRAQGEALQMRDISDEMVERWGGLLGQLQAHGRRFTPPGPFRPQFQDFTYLKRWTDFTESDPEFAAALRACSSRMNSQFTASGDGGLAHADLHMWNLHWAGGKPTAIDFDDCAYVDYSFDLAMPIFYAIRGMKDDDPVAAARKFMVPFLKGFLQVAPLPGGGPQAIADALDARRAELAAILPLKLPAEEWTDALRAARREFRDATVAGQPMVPAQDLDRIIRSVTG